MRYTCPPWCGASDPWLSPSWQQPMYCWGPCREPGNQEHWGALMWRMLHLMLSALRQKATHPYGMVWRHNYPFISGWHNVITSSVVINDRTLWTSWGSEDQRWERLEQISNPLSAFISRSGHAAWRLIAEPFTDLDCGINTYHLQPWHWEINAWPRYQ